MIDKGSEVTILNHLDKKKLRSLPFYKYICNRLCNYSIWGKYYMFLKLVCMPKHVFTLKIAAALRQLF